MDEPVLLTGAGGRVGQAILRGIGDDYEWRLLDREPLPAAKVPDGVTDAISTSPTSPTRTPSGRRWRASAR